MGTVNWKALVRDLCGRGWTQQLIAAHVGCKQPLISKLNCGRAKTCAYEVGHALVMLHASEEPSPETAHLHTPSPARRYSSRSSARSFCRAHSMSSFVNSMPASSIASPVRRHPTTRERVGKALP